MGPCIDHARRSTHMSDMLYRDIGDICIGKSHNVASSFDIGGKYLAIYC